MPYPLRELQTGGASVFDDASLLQLKRCYPGLPARLAHRLVGHPLLEPEALISLAERMRPQDAKCFRGDVPVGIEGGGAPFNGLTVADTVRNIAANKSWMVLKRVDQDPAYAELVDGLMAELAATTELATGEMLHREAFIFVSSPGSITPFHFDPEHNILMQVAGEKEMTVFSQHDRQLASGPAHESFHATGKYTLNWHEDYAVRGTAHRLAPGDALYVPVKAPHFVRNGDVPSISLSITWRSAWSFEEADAHGFNAFLRQMGLQPTPPRSWPARNRLKASARRILRRLPGFC